MKKKIISICITLILFCCSLVPVFATETVVDNLVPYWINDIYNQSFLSQNQHSSGNNQFGLGVGSATSKYVYRVAYGSSIYLTYHVPVGETVYFRWAINYNLISSAPSDYNTKVKVSVDGTALRETSYSKSKLGEYGSYGSIVMVEDYTNNSNSNQTVVFKITNNHEDPYCEYIPILSGTSAMFSEGDIAFNGSFGFTSDLSDIAEELEQIKTMLGNAYYQLPIELWQTYNFFTRNYNYSPNFNLFAMSDSTSSYSIPWLTVSSITSDTSFVKSKQFHLSSRLQKLQFIVLFNHNLDSTGHLKLYFEDGSSIQATREVANLIRTPGFDTMLYTFDLSSRGSGYASLSIPNNNAWKCMIPLYMGDGSNISELVSLYSSIPTDTQSKLSTIIDKFNSLISIFSSNNSTVDNATNANNQLSNSITEFDNLESNQVQNMTQNLNNLPTLDFNAYNDFAPTVQFVSNTMQQIYDSNQYLRLLINACLLIGISLLLIGRGNKK